ncbi:response regulator [Candidatus Sumerlaeota bacterium]|nr:response regulator [Candidatus Sumerlaeota bacterium]
MERIVVAEDDHVVRSLLTHVLQAGGYDVDSAKDGAEALESIRRQPPALVITDLDMPGLDGYGLIRAVRRHDAATKEIPILVLSCHASRGEVVKAIKMGASDFITKVDMEIPTLLQKVARLLGNEAPASPGAAPANGASGSATPPADPSNAGPEPAEASPAGTEAESAGQPESKGPSQTLPDAQAVGEFLSGMLGLSIDIEEGKPLDLGAKSPAIVAVYASDEGTLATLCVCDIALAGFVGAALSLIPAQVAKESIKARKLSEDLMENVQEVLNVGSSLFNTDDAPHVKMKTIHHPPGEPLPEDVAASISNPSRRLDLDITVPDYGPGKMALILA